MSTKALKPGTTVRLKQPVIEGLVVAPSVTDEDFGYMVDYKDEAGEFHHRFFRADQLEFVKAAEAAPVDEAPVTETPAA